jgi:hypothetical protein
LPFVEKELQWNTNNATLAHYTNARRKKEVDRRKEEARKKAEEDARKKAEEGQSSKDVRT